MQTISVAQLESETDSFIDRVAAGESFLVTIEERPAAYLVPHRKGKA
jgi:antitoxin (DNA-binding transcriptional repressor) of toxin-antitoxin stability system